MPKTNAEARKLWWASLTEEERKEINRKRAEALRAYWKSKKAAERVEFGRKVSEGMRNAKGEGK